MKWLRGLVRSGEESPTTSEVAVLDAILHGDDPRLRLIQQQLVRAPAIQRDHPAPDRYRVHPLSTFDDLSFQLEVGRLESRPLRVTDEATKRDLEFKVIVGRHGFLRGLEGRTLDDQPWPDEWSVELPVPRPDKPLMTLPPIDEVAAEQEAARRRLSQWLGVPIRDEVELIPPATEAAIEARQLEIGGRFSSGYRTLLDITDGLSVHGLYVHGHRDARPISNPVMPALLVAWDADDRDEFVVVTSLDPADDGVYRVDVHDETATPHVIADTFAEYLRVSVTPREPSQLA